MFSVKNHVLLQDGKPVAQKPSPNVGGALAPSLLVMHYTAAQSAPGAIAWLCNPAAKASAHLVIDQKGVVTQLAPFNRVAWHAGQSSWKGRRLCNGFSIGVEMANPGFLSKRANGIFYDAAGKIVDAAQVIMAHHKNGGPELPWMVYAPAQIDAAIGVAQAIVAAYPAIKEIVGHDDIAPRRKTDPGPAFPMASFVARVFGRK